MDMIREAREEKTQWYFNSWVIFFAILCFGPLGLLPLWFRPATKMYLKVSVSVVVIAATVWLSITTVDVIKQVADSYQQLAALY